jgi:hypothetical protein
MGDKPLDLQTVWNGFVEDFAFDLLNPTLNSSGSYFTHGTLMTVHNYGLMHAVLGLVRTHGPLTFSAGLPSLPHDFGYDIFSVTIQNDRVVVLIVIPPKQRLRKVGKKMSSLNRLVREDRMPTLAGFDVPIEWRFQGGTR